MDSISKEIQLLQLRIDKLEKQKNTNNNSEKNLTEPITYNFDIINNLLDEKKKAIKNNCYSKSVPLARYYDQELVTHLEAIHNLLQIFNERLDKLEN